MHASRRVASLVPHRVDQARRCSTAGVDEISPPRSRRRETPRAVRAARRRRRPRACSVRGGRSRRRDCARRALRAGRARGRRPGCGPGKPYLPIDVDVLLGEPTVALRGPWGGGDLVKIGPTAADLARGASSTTSTFPGTRSTPAAGTCGGRDARRGTRAGRVRARRDRARIPGQAGAAVLVLLRLQRLEQPARRRLGDDPARLRCGDARRGAAAAPVEVGYSQHEGAERAAWGDDKLELVDGTHPVVHPAAGSHANFYDEALYLGSSAERRRRLRRHAGPTSTSARSCETIPSDPAAARGAFPWIAFEGRWGELSRRSSTGRPGRT